MRKILVRGNGKPLIGKIRINGSKNSVLPIMAASLLTDSPIILYNVPDLTDVQNMSEVLKSLGAEVNFVYNSNYKGNHALKIESKNIKNLNISYEAATKIRTSILTLGPILSRFGQISTVFPGGCKIGKRPVDLHIKALEEMGANIEIDGCTISAKTGGKFKGREIKFEKISVGATQNIIMAATLAEGVTTMVNPAIEPEINDLIDFLRIMGADIEINYSNIVITGVEALRGCSYKIMPDRIEAGTYALAALMTNGRLELEGINLSCMEFLADKLEAAGCKIESHEEEVIVVSRINDFVKSVNVATGPHPKFPTDMQPQFTTALCIADGTSIIEENVFENRFAYVNELRKLGASVSLEKNKATVNGIKKFYGATDIRATDLRATAALLVAAVTADGETIINEAFHLFRGYEAMPEKLNSCGADISVF